MDSVDWKIESGEWRMEIGWWRVETREWRAECGEWQCTSHHFMNRVHVEGEGEGFAKGWYWLHLISFLFEMVYDLYLFFER